MKRFARTFSNQSARIFNLLDKVVGRDLKDLMNSFLGGKSERAKKKKSPEAAPATQGTETAATPAGSP
jgi:hypothetical protein